jgi:tetratricopeptide (TPR) repeat protein
MMMSMGSPKEVLDRVQEAQCAGNHKEAINLLESALVEWPNMPLLWLFLASSQRDTKQFTASVMSAQDGLKRVRGESDPSFAMAYCELGMTYLKWSQEREDSSLLESARECFTRCLAASPKQLTRDAAYVFLAVVERRLGHVEKAVSLYREALIANPRSEEAMFNLSMILRESNPDESESLLRRALELDPAYPEAAIELSRLADSRGSTEEAITVLRRVLEQAPDEVGVATRLAVLLEETDPDEAIRLLRHVLAVDPDCAKAYRDLAFLLHTRGENEEAEHLLKRSLDLNSQSYWSHSVLADVYFSQGRHEESKQACLQAVQLKPGRADAHWQLGRVFRETGDNEKAQREFRQAFELESDEPAYLYGLARCLVEQGRLAEGRDLLIRLQQLDPDYEVESVGSLLRMSGEGNANE